MYQAGCVRVRPEAKNSWCSDNETSEPGQGVAEHKWAVMIGVIASLKLNTIYDVACLIR